MAARTSTKRAAAEPAASTPAIPDEVLDKWIELRTDRAHTSVGYTSVTALFGDFAEWHEAAYPDAPPPTRLEFVMALQTAPRIRIETMLIQVAFDRKRMAPCANLTLRRALRSVA